MDSSQENYNVANVVIRSALCNRGEFINVAHTNAQSLCNKMDEFKCIIRNAPLDVICVTETWFREEMSSVEFDLNGFKLCRKDRILKKKKRGGGVCLYVKDNIKFKVITLDSQIEKQIKSEIDFLFIELILGEKKF